MYEELISQYQELDQPTASMGIINFIIEGRAAGHYDLLQDVILSTRDVDLRRYGLVMMAAARDDELGQRLLRLAKLARQDDLPLFIDAVEICHLSEREETLEKLRQAAGS